MSSRSCTIIVYYASAVFYLFSIILVHLETENIRGFGTAFRANSSDLNIHCILCVSMPHYFCLIQIVFPDSLMQAWKQSRFQLSSFSFLYRFFQHKYNTEVHCVSLCRQYRRESPKRDKQISTWSLKQIYWPLDLWWSEALSATHYPHIIFFSRISAELFPLVSTGNTIKDRETGLRFIY